ncbi:MAG: hypothetical protein ABI333_22985 [bacterium]
MNATFVGGALLGMLGALLINIGKGVEKQKVHVFKQGRKMFSPPHRRDLGIWLCGMAMTATAAIPMSLGLKLSESPSTIGAMTGVGLIGLVIYASRVVGEKISGRDGAGIALVVVGTSVLGYLGGLDKAAARSFETGALLKAVALPASLAIAGCVASRFWVRIHAIAWGATAGVCIGLSIFLADAALVRAGGDFVGQLRNPYPYIALSIGIIATFTTQIGFLKGRALDVVPAVNSAAILTPLLLEVILYKNVPGVLDLLMIAVIVAGVYLLSTGTAAKVAA